MPKNIALILIVCLAGATSTASMADPQTRAGGESTAAIDEVLKAVRSDLQSDRADIVAKNVTLTSDQAARFWPLFATYQNEQSAIMDDQLRAIQQFIEKFDSLDDAGAIALINGHFERDARMTALRQKWLAEFQKAIGTKLAVRTMQIDRRLSLAHQLMFASKIPLAH